MGSCGSGAEHAGLVISEEVLASIAVTAAKDVEGLSSIVPQAPALPGVRRRGASLRLVRISGGADGLTMQLSVRIRAGSRISVVAGGIQRAVKAAVQSMTGRAVSKININVAGADFK
ncbi:MAG: Asp23/Gls24 family envelope stress response protein [Oscillospiraceae bacterium]|jgi:uncharacterized alkaline shock family protein YloU|nr:Asp23/Gls24 family envelope stress response protein [Oscillospiraceae bacterium]